jgi:large subunit ribosomal protein L16
MQIPPQKTKFRKSHKMRVKMIKYSKGGCDFLLGTTALKALKAKRILPRQIEAARRVIAKKLTKKNKMLIRIFADTPVSQKPKEVRMGKGKGAVAF